jgi:hypothetical protein
MPKFKPIVRKPGEIIKSDDWNQMQEDILADFGEVERKLQVLRDYIDNMEETTTMLNMASYVGKTYNLDENIEGESTSYESPIVGLLTKQLLLPKGKTGEICRFSVVSHLVSLDYWAGAEGGNKKALDVVFSYIDGTNATVNDLFIHDRTKLRPKGSQNPYVEYLLAPNEYVWYRYRVSNPNPEKEVLTVSFNNKDSECTPRIGNVIHYRARLIPSNVLLE